MTGAPSNARTRKPVISRLVRAAAPSPISEARARAAVEPSGTGLPLLDVAQATPGYPPAPGLQRRMAELDHRAVSRYGPVLGEAPLREALARELSSAYRAPVRPEQAAITAGANQAFCLAVSVLCEPGDEVILPIPYYFNHDMWLAINGVEAVYLPCSGDMLPSPADADALLTERTRAVVLVTPNNPTGRVYPPALISAFADLAAERGICLILDETYRHFRSTAEPAHHLFRDPDWDRHLIHIDSFSKVYAITGYRVGGLAASPGLLTEAEKVADCLTICPNRLGQEAALYGLGRLEGWVEENRRAASRRIGEFTKTAGGRPYEVASAGGHFVYVRHPFEGAPAREVAQRLYDEQAVLALSGDMFGPGQDRYLRLAFANVSDSDVPELARRLAESALMFA